jgi:hypothetical protein
MSPLPYNSAVVQNDKRRREFVIWGVPLSEDGGKAHTGGQEGRRAVSAREVERR